MWPMTILWGRMFSDVEVQAFTFLVVRMKELVEPFEMVSWLVMVHVFRFYLHHEYPNAEILELFLMGLRIQLVYLVDPLVQPMVILSIAPMRLIEDVIDGVGALEFVR
jgi:hypothetical protein